MTMQFFLKQPLGYEYPVKQVCLTKPKSLWDALLNFVCHMVLGQPLKVHRHQRAVKREIMDQLLSTLYFLHSGKTSTA